jgi:hypothetical protein
MTATGILLASHLILQFRMFSHLYIVSVLMNGYSAIGMTVSAIAFLQAIAQIYFHNEHRLSPLGLFMSNALLTILWVVVIGLGWATPSEHFDFNPDGYSGYVSDIQGWERVYADAYKLVNEEEYYLNMLGNYGIDAVLGFAMGFIVMTILSL